MDDELLNDVDEFVRDLHRVILLDDFDGAASLSRGFIKPRMGPGRAKQVLFRGNPENLSNAIDPEARSAYCAYFPDPYSSPGSLSTHACLALRTLLGRLPVFALGQEHRPKRLLAEMRELAEEYLAHRGIAFSEQGELKPSGQSAWLHSPSEKPPARFHGGSRTTVPVLATQAEIGFLLRPPNDRKVSDTALRDHLKKIAGMANPRVWVRATRTRRIEAFFCPDYFRLDLTLELATYRKSRRTKVRASSRNQLSQKSRPPRQKRPH